MASYFRACAKSAPDVVTVTPEALRVLREGTSAADDVDDATDQRATVAAPLTAVLDEAVKPTLTDPRNIDTVIGQTRAMLDAPDAAALRRQIRRNESLQAKELERAAKEAKRAADIEKRNAEVLRQVAEKRERERQASLAEAEGEAGSAAPRSEPASPAAAKPSLATPLPAEASAAELDTLPVPVRVDNMDAFSRLRVEEERMRLEDARRLAAGGNQSIVAVYVEEDIGLTSSVEVAKKAREMADRTAQATPLHQRVAARRQRDSREQAEAAIKAAAEKLGLSAIDEENASQKAAAQADERISALRSHDAAVAGSIAELKRAEDAEREERARRAKHQNDQRTLMLDASRSLQRRSERMDALRAAKETSSVQKTAEEFPSAADHMSSVSFAAASIIRSRPAGPGDSRLVPSAIETSAQQLSANLLRQERAEHPIDAYQRRVREDLMRDRGYDDDTIAAVEAAIADSSLVQLADSHDALRAV